MSELLPGVFRVDRAGMPGRPGTLNVCLLVADDGSATLVDAGFPGIAEAVQATLAETRVSESSLRRVLVTHHHVDHTGGLPEIVAMSGADVWAHKDDVPFIAGAMPHRDDARPMPEHVHAQPTRVDLHLVGGEVLDVLGGCHILHTPGHTPGHLSLYLPALSLLVAGDIVRYENGTVTRAPEMFTADLELAERSLRFIAGLEFERLLPYHGDFLSKGASARLRRDLGYAQ
jgi:glyoxylase-like metal-dependent hydrolase (beta-lactamase superfamily II)